MIKDQYPTYQPIGLFYDTHGMDHRVFVYKLVTHSHKVLSYIVIDGKYTLQPILPTRLHLPLHHNHILYGILHERSELRS